jgi:hypothetical protein
MVAGVVTFIIGSSAKTPKTNTYYRDNLAFESIKSKLAL